MFLKKNANFKEENLKYFSAFLFFLFICFVPVFAEESNPIDEIFNTVEISDNSQASINKLSNMYYKAWKREFENVSKIFRSRITEKRVLEDFDRYIKAVEKFGEYAGTIGSMNNFGGTLGICESLDASAEHYKFATLFLVKSLNKYNRLHGKEPYKWVFNGFRE